jgi:hypothetical protein
MIIQNQTQFANLLGKLNLFVKNKNFKLFFKRLSKINYHKESLSYLSKVALDKF